MSNKHMDADLLDIPYIGITSAEKFKSNGIENAYQLIGKILSFKKKYQTPRDLFNTVYQYLCNIGIITYRTRLTICLIRKTDIMMPGFCDMDEIRTYVKSEFKK